MWSNANIVSLMLVPVLHPSDSRHHNMERVEMEDIRSLMTELLKQRSFASVESSICLLLLDMTVLLFYYLFDLARCSWNALCEEAALDHTSRCRRKPAALVMVRVSGPCQCQAHFILLQPVTFAISSKRMLFLYFHCSGRRNSPCIVHSMSIMLVTVGLYQWLDFLQS